MRSLNRRLRRAILMELVNQNARRGEPLPMIVLEILGRHHPALVDQIQPGKGIP